MSSLASSSDLKQIARTIFANALAECSIDRAFARTLHTVTDASGSHLLLEGHDPIALDCLKHVRIVSMGKAAAAMLDSLLSRLPLPPSIDLQGVLIASERPPDLPASIQYFRGGHPLPNSESLAAAAASLAMLQSLESAAHNRTLCIFLISGGASAMMELPLDSSISLDDAVAFHQALVHSGASIVEVNCVRKHFSAVKGGRLALAAGDAQKISLLVSDVSPAHLDALASGPTLCDPTTVAQCRDILARYNLLPRFPASVRRFFQSPVLPETPKPGAFESPAWKLIDSDDLAEHARMYAAQLGFHAVIDNSCDDWTYDAAANYLLNRLRRLRQEHPKVCLISTGEVTVQVPDARTTHPRSGGRNQHFALYIATRLHAEDHALAVLSAGSDGIDGNSTAAGAVIDEHTLNDECPARDTVRAADIQSPRRATAQHALASFDSSSWLNRFRATVVTGPTGHNLRDLRILLAE